MLNTPDGKLPWKRFGIVTATSLRQLQNALSSMLVTLAGIVTSHISSQPLKAQAPMLVTKSGIVSL